MRQFSSVGMKLGEPEATRIVALSGNVPYYLQALGSWTFRTVSERGGKSIRLSDVEEAFEQMFASERDLFENLFRALPESQRLVVRAIAREPVSSFTEDYRIRHFLPTLSTVGTAARRLAADSRIDVVDGKYQLLDPLFAHYCREKV